MNNTPTPKSDKNTYNKHQDNCPTRVVPSLICRQLERELTAAREELAELKEEYGTWWAQKRIAIDELKEVTEQRDRLAEALQKNLLTTWIDEIEFEVFREAISALKEETDER